MLCTSSLTIENCEILRAGENIPSTIAIVFCVVLRSNACISCRRSHIFSHSIDASRSSLTNEFCFSISIEVKDKELSIVSSGTYITSQVNTPQFRSIKLIGIKIDVTSDSGLRVILGIRGIPLHDELVFTVSIYICRTAIVRGVSIVDTCSGAIKLKCRILISPRRNCYCGVDGFTIKKSYHLILCARSASLVNITSGIGYRS